MLKYLFNDNQTNKIPINVSVALWTRSFPKKHTHDFYEIILVCNNSLINILNNHSHVMSKNDICFVQPNNIHHIIGYKDQPTYFNIMIKIDFIKQLSSIYSPDFLKKLISTRYNTLSPQAYERIFTLLTTGRQLLENQIEKQQFLYRLAVIELLTSYAHQQIEINDVSSLQKPTLVNKAIELMSHPEYMISSIKDIANTLGISPEHLIRLFKKNGMASPNKLFLAYKLEYARTLLRTTDLKIITIAENVGFYNTHYFCKIFKEHYQITPSEYRKQNNIFS